MRSLMAAVLIIAPLSLAHAQVAPKSGTPAASVAHYSVMTTDIGTLLDDPAAKAVIEKHVPGMTTNEQIGMARAMTLKDIQQYSPDALTDKVLAETDADLAKLAVKPASPAK